MPENASAAVLRVLQIVMDVIKERGDGPKEDDKEFVYLFMFCCLFMFRGSDVHFDPVLRLRANDKLIGRLIGKAGQTIRGIMDESQVRLFVFKYINVFLPLYRLLFLYQKRLMNVTIAW
jgi:hypothetical protein